ncbi:MAG: nitroreductase family protein [bacterium]
MLEEIKTRRSIRRFREDSVDDHTIRTIVEMGTWAPSGLNNQPWRFVVVRSPEVRKRLAGQTKYGSTIESAPVCIAVFLSQPESYERVKDVQAIGACIQNMLLTIHHLGLGGVWLGEILKNRGRVEEILGVPEGCELMAVIAFGWPATAGGPGVRRPLGEVVLGWK